MASIPARRRDGIDGGMDGLGKPWYQSLRDGQLALRGTRSWQFLSSYHTKGRGAFIGREIWWNAREEKTTTTTKQGLAACKREDEAG